METVKRSVAARSWGRGWRSRWCTVDSGQWNLCMTLEWWPWATTRLSKPWREPQAHALQGVVGNNARTLAQCHSNAVTAARH